MTKDDTYTWCEFERFKKGSMMHTERTKGYILSWAAKKGNVIELPELTEPERCWTVTQVTDRVVSKEFVREAEKQHKNHRKATDV